MYMLLMYIYNVSTRYLLQIHSNPFQQNDHGNVVLILFSFDILEIMKVYDFSNYTCV